MKNYARVISFAIALSAAMAPQAFAQAQTQPGSGRSAVASQLGVFVYPKNHQDQAKQTKDENECYGSAKQQSGIDPAAAPPPPTEAQEQKGGGAKGAAGGAAIGAIAGDAGTGAAVGATAGAVRGRRQQRKANKQAEQQAQQDAKAQQQQTMDTFKKAFSACLDARQYSVK